ncbi:hypothetical protein [Rubrimonas cliftonensis]|uniref:Uncharacterized protein n=1 Tax=Rubrimonas cliftonensis TaxID=89524 RepID=A0A1H4D2F9_9RHOB|nr:hypothetical protein [Rubrimonas cliftonensis]SEA66771.1 hypothetical protein SAMN05444370_1092 [Rubrimonas cliftonensis]
MPDDSDLDDFEIVDTPPPPSFVSQMNRKPRNAPITFGYGTFVKYNTQHLIDVLVATARPPLFYWNKLGKDAIGRHDEYSL